MISVDITSMSFYFAQALQAQCYAVALLGRSRSVGFSGLWLRDSFPDAISYHLLSIESILISSPRWQICASNIQRSARISSKILWVSPKEIKQVYQYRDIPWYAVIYVIQDGLAYQIWPPDRLGAQVRKPKHQVWSNICRTSAGWHWTKNDSVGISMASAAYAHEIRMYLDISWYF